MATLLSPIRVLFMWFLVFHLADCDYFPIGHLCDGNTESNADLENAIVSILGKLTTVDSTTGFSAQSLTSLSGSSTVYGLAQCRGDAINTDQCAKCLQQAETALYAKCKAQTQAAIWYELCLIRFDVNNFFGSSTIDSRLFLKKSLKKTEKGTVFSRAVLALITDLKYSSTKSKGTYFSTQIEKNIRDLQGVTLYGMVQCTQDLPSSECNRCLAYISTAFSSECGTSIGCALHHTSCFFRYETYNFFTIV